MIIVLIVETMYSSTYESLTPNKRLIKID